MAVQSHRLLTQILQGLQPWRDCPGTWGLLVPCPRGGLVGSPSSYELDLQIPTCWQNEVQLPHICSKPKVWTETSQEIQHFLTSAGCTGVLWQLTSKARGFTAVETVLISVTTLQEKGSWSVQSRQVLGKRVLYFHKRDWLMFFSQDKWASNFLGLTHDCRPLTHEKLLTNTF